ncbi:MAG: PDZ domain-containing protein [Acidobacteria bacterium]|nr:PDZ domain-containing protein [Acidobacteriota bacterium]
MSLKTQSADSSAAARAAADTVNCPSCRAELPRGMRFCRLCGYRLGEGLAEYVETVRFDGTPLAPPAAPLAPFANFGGAAHGFRPADPATTALSSPARLRRKRARWIMWPLVGVVVVTLSGGAAVVRRFGNLGQRINITAPSAPRAFFGEGDFTEIDGEGVLIESVSPGGPAETAGLRDGDIVTTFDGKRVEEDDDLRRALRATPIGKSVAVEFLRDGAPMSVTMVTIAPDAYNPRAFVPAAGKGFWGVSGLRRVRVPGTNLHGVRLGGVSENRPADIAGLKEDDIVIEFDGRPVRTADGLGSYIDHSAPGTVVNVAVIRGGQRVEVPVKMGRE